MDGSTWQTVRGLVPEPPTPGANPNCTRGSGSGAGKWLFWGGRWEYRGKNTADPADLADLADLLTAKFRTIGRNRKKNTQAEYKLSTAK